MNILLIEDEPAIREYVTEAFVRARHQVFAKEDGDEA